MPRTITELEVRNAGPAERKYSLTAGHGLMLLVHQSGGKYWALRYRYGGKASTISVGKLYPSTG